MSEPEVVRIFLDEYDALGEARVKNSVSKNDRVHEINMDELADYKGYAGLVDGGTVFVLSPDLHKWFTFHKPGYDATVSLGFCLQPSSSDRSKDNYGFMLIFKEAKLATLFKLTYGGQLIR